MIVFNAQRAPKMGIKKVTTEESAVTWKACLNIIVYRPL